MAVNPFAIATIVMVFIVMLMFVFMAIAGIKRTWFFIKLRFGKVRNYGLIVKFRKGGLVEQVIERVPTEILTKKEDLLNKNAPSMGTKVLDPVHFDKVTKLPMYFVFEGDLTTTDFKDLFINNEIFQKALSEFPNLKEELKKIPMEDGKTLFEYTTTVDVFKKKPKNKMEEILNAIYVRAYQLGLIKGRNEVKANNSANWIIMVAVVIGMVAAIAAAYYGYTNHNEMLAMKDTLAKLVVEGTTTSGGTVIVPVK